MHLFEYHIHCISLSHNFARAVLMHPLQKQKTKFVAFMIKLCFFMDANETVLVITEERSCVLNH
jgi:hypothetical protein